MCHLNLSGTGFSGGYYWIHPAFVTLAPAIVPDWPQLSIKKSNSFDLPYWSSGN